MSQPTTAQAMDAARALEVWLAKLQQGAYDDWISYRVSCCAQPPATLVPDAGSRTLAITRDALTALQAAWKVATDYMETPEPWPLWRVYDWRQALPELIAAVRERAKDAPVYRGPTTVITSKPPASKPAPASGTSTGLKVAGLGLVAVLLAKVLL